MLQGPQQFSGPAPVEVQGRQRVAPPAGQNQEVTSQGEARSPQGVELRQRQREGPLAWRRRRRRSRTDIQSVLLSPLPPGGATPPSGVVYIILILHSTE